MKTKKPYVPKFDKKGHCEINPAYKEIFKLYDLLADSEISFSLRRNFDGWQILYPAAEHPSKAVASIIQHYGSYGGSADRLEIIGLLTPEEKEDDCVLGYLTAAEVYKRIKQHWESRP